jgi:uncharacterized protein (DUF433 family)
MFLASRNDEVVAASEDLSSTFTPPNCDPGHTSRHRHSDDFEAFAAEIRRDLSPASRLERVLSDRVVLAAWRLHRLSLAESKAAHKGGKLPPITREVLRAESSLETALTVLRDARDERRLRWGQAAATDSKAGYVLDEGHDDLSNEWPAFPNAREVDEPDFDGGPDDDHEDDDAHFLWRDRLTFDLNVSKSSPVVKGTWVTAGHVVSLIVDGWSWSDILRTHPELTEDDVRACLAYTVDQDGCEV